MPPQRLVSMTPSPLAHAGEKKTFLTFKELKSSCLFCRKADAPSQAIFVPHYQSLNRRLDHLDENVERLWSKLSTKDEASNSLALGKVIIKTNV